jgi:putative endopeptidase
MAAAEPQAASAPAGIQPAARPQDDLFQAANGRWLQDTPIPPNKSSYGSFTVLRDLSDARVRQIAEAAAAHVAEGQAAAGSAEQKIGRFYRSYIDEAAIDSRGMAPLAPWLQQIDDVKDTDGLVQLWGRWQGVVRTPVRAGVGPDRKEPGINRASLYQGGLGLPDREYYLGAEPNQVAARAAYQRYLEVLLAHTGSSDPAADAQTVFALETQLAQAQWTRVQNRDVLKSYNPMTVDALAVAAPGFEWRAFAAAAQLDRIDRWSVAQPSYATALADLLQHTPLATWKLYTRAALADGLADVLPKALRDADFAFHGKALQGQPQPLPRWQQASAQLGGVLGEAVGQLYVAQYFPPAYKARMRALVDQLMAAYASSIDHLAWMGPETKLKAQAKLAKYAVKIGYPDQWRDIAALDIVDGDALGNSARCQRFEYARRAAQLGRPVDRSEWHLTPQTVNAYYNPSFNEVVFPAAILQPPFFDAAADDAVNYGAIGAVIGHEISHGFDDQGSQFDGDGKLENWWTDADRKAFEALGARLVAEFDALQPVPGHPVNGKLTLGENIADLSGLQIAYKAYHRSLGGQPAPVIDGLTGDQRFFFGWARAWRNKMRDERALQLLAVDPHSPTQFRANQPAMNLDAFAQAFDVKPGDGMYRAPAERIHIW